MLAPTAVKIIFGLLLLSGLAGYASFEQLTRPPIEPPQEGGSWIRGTGGVRLYFSARMPAGEPWGIVYFVLGTEIGADEPYPKLTAALHASGIVTLVLHPRGAGFSDGVRGDIDDYDLFLADLQLGLERAQRSFPGKAVFLFGHSAGAALAFQVAAKAKTPLAGVILVNPAYKITYGEGMGPSLGDYVVFAFNAVFRRSALTVDMNGNPSAVKNPADREEALVDPRGNEEILAAAGMADKVKLVATKGAHGSTAVEMIVEELLVWLCAHRQR